MDCQPRHGVLKRPGEAGTVACPRHRRDHHAMLRAAHPRRVGHHVGADHPQVKGPPAPSALAPVEASTAPPALAAAAPLPAGRADRSDDHLGGLVKLHPLDHRLLDAEQLCPYPLGLHAVPPPYETSLGQPEP
jgi:hypothetical protein